MVSIICDIDLILIIPPFDIEQGGKNTHTHTKGGGVKNTKVIRKVGKEFKMCWSYKA